MPHNDILPPVVTFHFFVIIVYNKSESGVFGKERFNNKCITVSLCFHFTYFMVLHFQLNSIQPNCIVELVGGYRRCSSFHIISLFIVHVFLSCVK